MSGHDWVLPDRPHRGARPGRAWRGMAQKKHVATAHTVGYLRGGAGYCSTLRIRRPARSGSSAGRGQWAHRTGNRGVACHPPGKNLTRAESALGAHSHQPANAARDSMSFPVACLATISKSAVDTTERAWTAPWCDASAILRTVNRTPWRRVAAWNGPWNGFLNSPSAASAISTAQRHVLRASCLALRPRRSPGGCLTGACRVMG
jgi:hypothetical protein